MSELNSQFRGTAFGGFHRQDVLDYLAALDGEHRSQLSICHTELAAANTAREEAERDLEQERREAAQAKEDLQRVREDREELRDKLQKAEEKCRDTQEELDLVRQELDQAKRQVAQLTPDAQAYSRLKDRAATIELSAHERAQMQLDQAKADRLALQEETTRWVEEVRTRYDIFRGDVEGILAHSTRELERIQEAFSQISQELGNHEAALEDLMSACRETPELETV